MVTRILSWSIILGIFALNVAGCAPSQKISKAPPSAQPPSAKAMSDSALMRLAEERFSQERFQEAAEIYKSILRNFPKSPVENEARYRLALCYHHLDQPAETVKSLKILLEYDLPRPRQAKIFSLMAENYLKLDKPFNALRWYLEAIEAVDRQDLKEELQERTRRILSEDLSEAQLREVVFIYRDTHLAGYAKFLLARELFHVGKIDESRKMLSEVLRFHSQDYFFPEVEAFLEEMEEFVPDEYVLGCILPLSGRGASRFGEPSLNGIELAIHAFEPEYEDLNLRLIVKDSKSSPEGARQAVEELVYEEGVLAIVGPLFRSTSEAAAKRAQELRVPLITLTTKEDVTLEGDFVFRNGLSYPVQIRSLVDYAMNYLECHRFGVFYPEDGYGKTLSSLFIHEIYRQGGEVVTLESYAGEQMDFGSEIKQMFKIQDDEETGGRKDHRHFNPIIEFDAVFIPDQANRVALIAAQLAYYNVFGVTLLGTNAWNDSSLLEKAGEFVEGAFLVDEFFKDSQSAAIRDFVDRFRETFLEEPTILAAQAYDVARILVTLLEDHPILSREAMRQELSEVRDFPGTSGFKGFDPTGNAEKTPFVLTIRGKAFSEVSRDMTEGPEP